MKKTITITYYICDKGHKHVSLDKQKKCDEIARVAALKRAAHVIVDKNPPNGFLSTEQARDLFTSINRNNSVCCSSHDIRELVRAKVLEGIITHPNNPKSTHWVNIKSVRKLARKGKPVWELLGKRKIHKLGECPSCLKIISVSNRTGLVFPHSGHIGKCTGGKAVPIEG